MTVSELREFLKAYPEDMQILNERCSDYQIISIEDWSVVSGVDKGGWVMRSHRTMSDENKEKEKQYLLLFGN